MELQLKQNSPHNEPAFVLGNGKSRLNLNHTSLLPEGTVYACNAMYREFEPDFLIAVDVKMVNEIVASGWHRSHAVWTNPNKGISSKKGLNFFNPHKGWSSGPTALNFACSRGHLDVYIFGFDYQGIGGKFNNVYADTYNYKKSVDNATYHGNWLSQTEKTIKDFKRTNFYRVIKEGDYIPDRLKVLKNLEHLNYKDFEKIFPAAIYKDEMTQKSTI